MMRLDAEQVNICVYKICLCLREWFYMNLCTCVVFESTRWNENAKTKYEYQPKERTNELMWNVRHTEIQAHKAHNQICRVQRYMIVLLARMQVVTDGRRRAATETYSWTASPHTKYLIFLIKMETFVLLLFINAHLNVVFLNSDIVKQNKTEKKNHIRNGQFVSIGAAVFG